jgi:hypothetical protein
VRTPTTALRAPAGTPKTRPVWSGMTIFANHPFPLITSYPGVSLRFVEADR